MFEMGVVVAVIIALGQFIKQFVNSKYIPLVTLVLGVVAGFFFVDYVTIQEAVMNGIIIGLTANGTFDMTKSLHK